MRKKDIFRAILTGAKFVPGPVGAIASGVDHLIDRDDDPTNDLEETVSAIAEMAEEAIILTEGLTKKDLVDNAALALLSERLAADVRFYVRGVQALKPQKTA